MSLALLVPKFRKQGGSG